MRHQAGETLLAQRGDDSGQIALGSVRDHVGGAWPLAAHAHVERAVEPERKAALALVELHRRHADVEHDAIDGFVTELARQLVETGEPVFDQREPAADLQDETGAVRDRGLVTVDADHPRIGREDGLRVAAGAEGAVDVEAAGLDLEVPDRGAREHGNVTDRSASGVAAAAHGHSRTPSASSAALSESGDPRFGVASSPCRRTPNRPNSQICNLRQPPAPVGKLKADFGGTRRIMFCARHDCGTARSAAGPDPGSRRISLMPQPLEQGSQHDLRRHERASEMRTDGTWVRADPTPD